MRSEQTKFLEIIGQYQPALWRLVNSYEANPGRREDLFQEIALGIWQALPRFRGDASERTWLYRIAHNIAISTLESRRRRDTRELPMPDSVERIGRWRDPDQALVVEEQRQAMLAAIQELPAIDKQLIILHLEGLSYQEIEEVSGLTESAIASRLSRIRDRLTDSIRKQEIRK
ncbi:MAG TPA: RNA polymerase sigma factor [Bryobacteraceae bacterium]|nr:RNA polymerase sigma factor [Bryobacteraceae bacterium]